MSSYILLRSTQLAVSEHLMSTGGALVDRPTQLICIYDIYLSTYIGGQFARGAYDAVHTIAMHCSVIQA